MAKRWWWRLLPLRGRRRHLGPVYSAVRQAVRNTTLDGVTCVVSTSALWTTRDAFSAPVRGGIDRQVHEEIHDTIGGPVCFQVFDALNDPVYLEAI